MFLKMTASHVNPERIGYQLTNYLGGALSFVHPNESSPLYYWGTSHAPWRLHL